MWQFKIRRIRGIHGDAYVEAGSYTLSYNADVQIFRLSNLVESWFALCETEADNRVAFPNGVSVELEPHFDETSAMAPIKFELAYSAPLQEHNAPDPDELDHKDMNDRDGLGYVAPFTGLGNVSIETPHSAKQAEDEIKTCLIKLDRAVKLLSAARGQGGLGDLSACTNAQQEHKH